MACLTSRQFWLGLVCSPAFFAFATYADRMSVAALDMDEDMKYSMRMMAWKVNDRISLSAYNRLRKQLRPRIQLASLDSVARELQRITGCKAKYYDCCPQSHIMFTGRYARNTVCPHKGCGRRRFRDKDGNDFKVPLEHPDDSDDELDDKPMPPFIKRGGFNGEVSPQTLLQLPRELTSVISCGKPSSVPYISQSFRSFCIGCEIRCAAD